MLARREGTFTAANGLLHFNRSPDTATTKDIRRFQLRLAEAGVRRCKKMPPPVAGRRLLSFALAPLRHGGVVFASDLSQINGRLGKRHVERFHRVRHDLRHRQIAKPLVVRRD